MKKFLTIASILLSVSAAQAADVGVSISVGQPGFYGRLDIGDFPPPQVIYSRPRIVHEPHARIVEEPVYLRVPPGHAKNWRKHCHRYDACGRPVYFVKDRWYNEVYVPKHRERHARRDRGPDRGHGGDRYGDREHRRHR